MTRQVEPGTRIVLRTAGGGGFGDPLERILQDISRDVEEGLISIKMAGEEYGVVFNQATGQIDEDSTALVRKKARTKQDLLLQPKDQPTQKKQEVSS